MPGIATGETYSFAEGRLYLYASASGAVRGLGIGFAEGANLRLVWGWLNYQDLSGRYYDLLTGRRADLTIDTLYGDRTLFALAEGTAAVNAKFEGQVTGGGVNQSAQFILYSGKVDSMGLTQRDRDINRASYAMHANVWSAFGQ